MNKEEIKEIVELCNKHEVSFAFSNALADFIKKVIKRVESDFDPRSPR